MRGTTHVPKLVCSLAGKLTSYLSQSLAVKIFNTTLWNKKFAVAMLIIFWKKTRMKQVLATLNNKHIFLNDEILIDKLIKKKLVYVLYTER